MLLDLRTADEVGKLVDTTGIGRKGLQGVASDEKQSEVLLDALVEMRSEHLMSRCSVGPCLSQRVIKATDLVETSTPGKKARNCISTHCKTLQLRSTLINLPTARHSNPLPKALRYCSGPLALIF